MHCLCTHYRAVTPLLLCSLVFCVYAGNLAGQQDEMPATEKYQKLKEGKAAKKETIRFEGLDEKKYKDLRENVSGIVVNDEILVIGADEKASIQVLEKIEGDGNKKVYKVTEDITLDKDPKKDEIDIEALAADDDRLFVVGSHSAKRKRVMSLDDLKKAQEEEPEKFGKPGDARHCKENGDQDESKDPEKNPGCWKWNRKRLTETKPEPDRKRLLVLETEKNGKPKAETVQDLPLADIIAQHDVLAGFSEIPSKENGVDIEGLAVDGDKLYVGFRGPVLRGPYAVVLVVKWEEREGKYALKPKYKTRYLDLDGRGIRGMSTIDDRDLRNRIDGDVLVLAGPVGDAPTGWVIYSWDGKDSIPGLGRGAADDHVKALCRIPPPKKFPLAKAEGVAVLPSKDEDKIGFMIVYDSAEDGAPTVFTCPI
jgi:hypothetical protein